MKQLKNNRSDVLIGRTITGVISKPVAGGGETIVMLQFSDGTCFEFVSPRSAKVLKNITHLARRVRAEAPSPPQLSMFPQDGATPNQSATHLAA